MYHTEPLTDKTIREWYMNSSRVAACALRKEIGRPDLWAMGFLNLYTPILNTFSLIFLTSCFIQVAHTTQEELLASILTIINSIFTVHICTVTSKYCY